MNVTRYAKVALFFVVLGAVGIGYVVLSADGFSGFNTVAYSAVLPDATGLSQQSKVYMAGVQVGKIDGISISGRQARIKMAILKDVELHEGATIARRSSSILGTSMIALDPGNDFEPVLPPGSMLGTTRGGDLMSVASDVLEEIRNNHLQLLEVSIQTFNSIAGKLDAVMDAELAKISEILDNAVNITANVDYILSAHGEDISLSLSEVRLALQNIRAISDQIASGEGTVGELIYDDSLYNEVEVAVVKLQTAIDGANEFLARANNMGLLIDTGANYGFNSKNVRAGASLVLEPASGDRWYRLGVNGAPDGISTRTVTTTSGTATSYEDKTETKYTFSIDAEIARRFGMVTVRGGLLESTAGLGVDIRPVRWVALSGEVFKFKNDSLPNLRATATFYPFYNPEANNPLNWLYLKAGVYDTLNKDRDFFLGGGVRFSDREIKGLAGMAFTVYGAQ
ncbi:MAG: MlaD family protein [Treponema sp.]|jgi:phospholipid/cholesterol/gamma-HCH transport system substrate-binding protein|nr:MlaD family protein [Treponema sp.]